MRPCISLAILAALPLGAQAWDLRVELPFAKGQNLPQTLIQGTGQLATNSLDTSKGMILTASHRIVRVGPVLKLEWGAEATRWTSDGSLRLGSSAQGSSLQQQGFGLGANAQFWVPFTGLAGELGLIQRFQQYRLEGVGIRNEENLNRTWLRAALRFRLPLGPISPYLTASYQQPLTRERPIQVNSAADLASYLRVQGKGAEFERMWTFGGGLQF